MLLLYNMSMYLCMFIRTSFIQNSYPLFAIPRSEIGMAFFYYAIGSGFFFILQLGLAFFFKKKNYIMPSILFYLSFKHFQTKIKVVIK